MQGDLSGVRQLSLDIASISIEIPRFLPDGVDPVDVDLDNTYGRFGWVDENADGTAIDQTIDDVDWWVASNLQVVSFGDANQTLKFTIQNQDFADTGQIWSQTALGPARFPDMANPLPAAVIAAGLDRNPRAKCASGGYYPIPICPAVPTLFIYLESPLFVVRDWGGTDSVIQRFLITYEPLAGGAGPYPMFIMGRGQDEVIGDLSTGIQTTSPYDSQTIILAGSNVFLYGEPDGLGDCYWALDNDLRELWAIGNFNFETSGIGVPSIITGGYGANLASYGSGDFIFDPAQPLAGGIIDSVAPGPTYLDGGGVAQPGGIITLTDVEAGPFLAQDAEFIRNTVESATAGYLQLGAAGLGGIFGADGGVLDNPGEFLIWLLRKSIPTYPYAFEDLYDIQGHTAGWWVATVLSAADSGGVSNTSPWEYCLAHMFTWLPVIPYLFRGRTRFLWDGWMPSLSAVTTIDIAPNSGSGIIRTSQDLYSRGLWDAGSLDSDAQDGCIINALDCQYQWQIRRQKYLQEFVIGGYNSPTYVTGRTLTSQARYQNATQPQPSVRFGNLDLDCVGDDCTAGIASALYLLKYAQRRTRIGLELPANYRWIDPGMCVALQDSTTVGVDGLWRCLSQVRAKDGTVKMVFEALPI
jgi:hypothetical protein